jgi:hypothetical protein
MNSVAVGRVCVDVSEGTILGNGVIVEVGVRDGVGVKVWVVVGTGVSVWVAEAVTEKVMVALGSGVWVADGCKAIGVRVGKSVGGSGVLDGKAACSTISVGVSEGVKVAKTFKVGNGSWLDWQAANARITTRATMNM